MTNICSQLQFLCWSEKAFGKKINVATFSREARYNAWPLSLMWSAIIKSCLILTESPCRSCHHSERCKPMKEPISWYMQTSLLHTLQCTIVLSHIVFLDAIPLRCTNPIIFLCSRLLTLCHRVTRLNTFKIIKTFHFSMSHLNSRKYRRITVTAFYTARRLKVRAFWL